MSCTASVCRCRKCGSHGSGDLQAAIERAQIRAAEELRKIAERAAQPRVQKYDGFRD